MSMVDVTARIKAVLKPGMDAKEALAARQAEMARLEKESLAATGLRSDIVSLYQGGEYWIYRYKKYTDIRLVFAPEQQIAFFGGDPDNFTYPRYDLDMAIFRVYEDGKAIKSPNHLKWNPMGTRAGDLVFISGHPGTTQRLDTVSQLELMRDQTFPIALKQIRRRLAVLRAYAARGPEEARQTQTLIFGNENSLKAREGIYKGLLDTRIMAKKVKDEKTFRDLVAGRADWREAYGSAWDDIAQAEKRLGERMKPLYCRTLGRGMAGSALGLLRYVTETAKPDGTRLREFHDAGLESLRFSLLSPAPVYPALEEALLADTLRMSLEELGPDDPFVKAALQGRTPEDVARELISGTALADPAERRRLLEGGSAAVAASRDPLLAFVKRMDPFLREMRTWSEDTVEGALTAAGERIGKARFEVFGKAVNPDANFTLRLTYGEVKGYPMNGTLAPPQTTFYGLFDRAASFGDKGPFALPARYKEAREKLDLGTQYDFVSTCDIIGGNSGSPVVDKAGEIVGLVFDGNIESLVGDLVYDDTANRAVAVSTAAMTEALRKVYDAGFILEEMGVR
jgi:hypothetical protein